MVREHFEALVEALAREARAYYGERLVSLAIFGSVARGTMRPDSDLDVLVVAEPLPDGRIARVREFDAVEEALSPELARAASAGVHTRIAAVFYTPAEVRAGSPLFLDMTRHVRVLEDRGGFLAAYLQALAARLRAQGARHVDAPGGGYWVLAEPWQPGQRVEL